jgi:soluble lytic murein transglycosylase-like protein
MRPHTALLPLAAALALAAPASAAVPHVIQPGETLWSIAAANNFTTRALAAFNGLSPDANVMLGSTLQVPTVAEAAARLAGLTSAAGTAPTAAAASPPPALGAYTVRPGDTLSGLAAQSRVSPSAIAAMNGIAPDAQLIAGTALKMPTGSPVANEASPAPTTAPAAYPAATPGRVTSADIAAVATRNGVPASLASAIAWQESGFNNGMVSAANARGVMQVMPGTWNYVQQNLALRHLDPASAIDNVGAGVLYLGQLLRETGGDPALAAAGYYQGIGSVRRIGMLPETRRYVDNVLALRSRFPG